MQLFVGSCKKLWPVAEGSNHHTSMNELKLFVEDPFDFCVINDEFQVRGYKVGLDRAKVNADDLSLGIFVRCSKGMLVGSNLGHGN